MVFNFFIDNDLNLFSALSLERILNHLITRHLRFLLRIRLYESINRIVFDHELGRLLIDLDHMTWCLLRAAHEMNLILKLDVSSIMLVNV